MRTPDIAHHDMSQSSENFKRHVLQTYMSLRVGMGVVTAAFPILMYVVGRMSGVGLQDSISAYYWQDGTNPGTPRVWFCGVLFALAVFFWLYRGFTNKEDWAFKLAAVCAIGVACVPMPWPEHSPVHGYRLHDVLAVGTFACLAYVVWFRAADTLHYLPNPHHIPRYRVKYRIISVLMAAAPLTAVVLTALFDQHSAYIFFIEACGIWAFAYFWWVKDHELKESLALHRLLGANS
jgi:hypothetical protein